MRYGKDITELVEEMTHEEETARPSIDQVLFKLARLEDKNWLQKCQIDKNGFVPDTECLFGKNHLHTQLQQAWASEEKFVDLVGTNHEQALKNCDPKTAKPVHDQQTGVFYMWNSEEKS